MENSYHHSCPVLEAEQFSSPLISIGDFKQQCRDLIGDKTLDFRQREPTHENMSILLNTNQETVNELNEICSVDNLKCEMEDEIDYNKARLFETLPNPTDIQVLDMTKKMKTQHEELFYVPTFSESISEDVSNAKESDFVPPGEVLLTVSLAYPSNARKIHQEYLVLDDHKLTDLKDVISCVSDRTIEGEFSKNPDLSHAKTAKEVFPSSYFFIEKCFYNDLRSPLNRDNSKVVIDWARDTERYTIPGLGILDSARMESTRFADLNFRLGYPYLYSHQGNCEHILLFTDMKILTKDDPQLKSSYPYKLRLISRKPRKCSVCEIHYAKWKTKCDPLAFEDPSFFCQKCFDYLHYDTEGKPIVEFQAYPYLGVDCD